jgi:hypothetical protein
MSGRVNGSSLGQVFSHARLGNRTAVKQPIDALCPELWRPEAAR